MRAVIRAAVPGAARRWIRQQQRIYLDRKLFLRHLRATDVFLVGHPKSGNTWLAYMLAIVLQDDPAAVTLANVARFVPFVHGRDTGIAEHEALPDPRVFRNEKPEFGRLYPRTIYLVRDPRAVLASYFDMHRTMFPDRELTFQSFLDEYLRHGCIPSWERITRWDRQVGAWMTRAQRDDTVLIVRYEDMVLDREGTLRQVLEFSGIPYTGPRLEAAVTGGSFEAMRRSEERYGAESYPGEIGKRGRFIRRGKVDGWKDELDHDAVGRIAREFAPVMKRAGYA